MANPSVYILMLILGTFKFMFASVPGVIAGISFINIYLTVLLGGLISFNFFYFMSTAFIQINLKNKLKKIELGTYIPKKNFTKINKTIVKLKMTDFGFWVLTILAPIVFSIPVGAIIIAKFYRHHKESYWISSISLAIFGALFTLIALLFKS